MPEDQDKNLGLPVNLGDDTSGEMDIIKQALQEDKPAVATVEPIFNLDLFAEPAKTEPAPPPEPAPAPAKETPEPPAPAPGPLPKKGEEPATISAPLPPPQEIPAPVPERPVSTATAKDTIKIVTDEDLKSLFEASSPGFSPEGPAPEPEKESESVATPKPPVAMPAPASPEKTEEVGEKVAEMEKPAPLTPPVETAPPPPAKMLEEISPEEIIDQLETRAQVGEMTAVAAGKKGQLLEKMAGLISQLEPAGEDLMNVTELKRLFNNVNLLIQIVKETTQRLDRLEARLQKLDGEED